MNDLNPKAQALIDSVRDADGPTRQERSRVKRRVLARAAGVILATSAGASSTATAAAGAWSAKMVVVAAIAATTFVAGGTATSLVVAHRNARHRATVATTSMPDGHVAASAPLASSLPPPATPRAVAVPPSTEELAQPLTTEMHVLAPRGPAVHSLAPPAEPRRDRETLEEELPLLQKAQEALRLGEIDRALSLLDAHAQRFPDGALSEERRAEHALAVCRKTSDRSARSEAEAFLRSSASSPLVETVRRTCSVPGP